MSFDRRAAIPLGLLAAASLVLTIAFSDPPVAAAEHDEQAYADLIARLEASESSDWLVHYVATREVPTGERASRATAEGQLGDSRIWREPTSVTTQRGAERVVCELVPDGLQCFPKEIAEVLPASVIVETLVESGAYVVNRLPSETIADEEVRCFRVFGTRGFEPDFGLERQLCLSRDGIPMRTRVTRATGVDEQTATSVQRDPSAADLEALVTELDELDQAALEPEN